MSKGGSNMPKILGGGCALGILLAFLAAGSAFSFPLMLLTGSDNAFSLQGFGNASQRLRGVPQSSSWPGPTPNGSYNSEYHSASQAGEWSPRSCGAASVTAVLRAFGIPNQDGEMVRIGDVLEVAIDENAIASPGGWQGDNKFEPVLDHFAPFVSEDISGDMDEIIERANAGYPVITSVKSSYVFTGGHILVIAGGDQNSVLLADSSGYWGGNREELKIVNRNEFESMWRGNRSLGLVVYPEGYDPEAFGMGGDQPMPDISNESHGVRVGPVLTRVNPSLAGKQGQVAQVSRQDMAHMAEIIAMEEGVPPSLLVRQIYRESGFNPFAVSPSGNHFGLTQQSLTWAQSNAGMTVGNLRTDVEDAVRAMARGMQRHVTSQMQYTNNDPQVAYQRALAMYNWGPAHFPPSHMTSAPYRDDWLTCSHSSSSSCAPAETKKYIGFIMYNDENKFM